MVAFVVGVGLLVAALTVFYRDEQYVVESLLTILFWLSPILYRSDYEHWIARAVTTGGTVVPDAGSTKRKQPGAPFAVGSIGGVARASPKNGDANVAGDGGSSPEMFVM